LCAHDCAANAIAKVLSKVAIVFLHSGCSRCIAVVQGAVDDVEALLILVQSQLKIGSATAWEVLGAPFDVKDAVGRNSTRRREDSKSGV
jgi:hypothetical protein